MATIDRAKQMREAEEILGDRWQEIGFVKGLFFGQYLADRLLPYPDVARDGDTAELVGRLQQFCATKIDPVAIDRQAEIPRSVIGGLGQLGILGACLPKEAGGLALSQTSYCRLLEVLGGHCGSTALFVNAHHSIGPRAIVLFGTEEQRRRYLPKLASGEWISAFALTEPEAGSDAANVQSTATPSADGSGFLINGEKRWITNGGIADVLTVMARTPAGGGETQDHGVYRHARHARLQRRREADGEDGGPRHGNQPAGVRRDVRPARKRPGAARQRAEGRADGARLWPHDVWRELHRGGQVLRGPRGGHVQRRVQFGQPLASFELVKEKLAYMQAGTFAMEACTYQTAALIDSGEGDFMLETAMLKVFATETLWRILNDTFQLHGGLAYFTDQPFERMVRDARINTIGEGANDVLRAFTALVGMRDVGLELQGIRDAIYAPLGNVSRLSRFAGRKLGALLVSPSVPVRSSELEPDAAELARLVSAFGNAIDRLLVQHQLEIVDRQYLLGRVADAATELYVSACVLNRLDFLLRTEHEINGQLRLDLETGRYYLRTARRRIRHALAALTDNDDEATTSLANRMLRQRRV
jgi:acyl-CoA dehydrogenase family member 9